MINENKFEEILRRNHSHGLNIALRHLIKEVKIYNNHLSGMKALDGSTRHLNTEKIQVGGGNHYLEGFLNIDAFPPADIICDVREGLPLRDECSDYIFSEHFLEHLDYPVSSKNFFNDCFRALRSKGKIVVGVPDSSLIVNKYFNKDKAFYRKMIKEWYKNRDCLGHINTYIDLLNYHFRDQADNLKYNQHYWGYDYEKLKSLMENAGFVNVKKWKFDNKIASPKRKWGSLYVISEKP